MKKINELFSAMWKNYLLLNPQAEKIVETIKAEGEEIVNDHIALRTLNLKETSIDQVAKVFVQAGYKAKGEYHFEAKKLFAKHYEHEDESLPKVFISELLLEHFSKEFRETLTSLVRSEDVHFYQKDDLMIQGRAWDISYKTYEKLKKESEYGAWLAALGFRPNHFTISINHLKKFNEVKELNEFLKNKGFKLNAEGGEIKGSADVYLEQSSTLANNVEISFSDGKYTIPSCYFEFAKRYQMNDGKLYQGFVAKSADKIFESTDKGQ